MGQHDFFNKSKKKLFFLKYFLTLFKMCQIITSITQYLSLKINKKSIKQLDLKQNYGISKNKIK